MRLPSLWLFFRYPPLFSSFVWETIHRNKNYVFRQYKGRMLWQAKEKTYFLLQSVLWPPCENFPRAKRKTFLILLPILRRGGRGERYGAEFPPPPAILLCFSLWPTLHRRPYDGEEKKLVCRNNCPASVVRTSVCPPPKSIPPGSDLFLCPKVQHCSVAGKRGGALWLQL